MGGLQPRGNANQVGENGDKRTDALRARSIEVTDKEGLIKAERVRPHFEEALSFRIGP